MPKKIEPYLNFEKLEEHCFSAHDLIYYMRGWFESFAFEYNKMKMSEIKRYIEDLKVAFEFLDKRGFEK